eukprot:scaffold1155_cov95-Cylindrotheca_fusiformis.AAC.4
MSYSPDLASAFPGQRKQTTDIKKLSKSNASSKNRDYALVYFWNRGNRQAFVSKPTTDKKGNYVLGVPFRFPLKHLKEFVPFANGRPLGAIADPPTERKRSSKKGRKRARSSTPVDDELKPAAAAYGRRRSSGDDTDADP